MDPINPTITAPTEAATATDWRAKLIILLALTPAEGATEVDDAAIETALAALTTTGARATELETAAGTAAEQLGAANAELERVRADYTVIAERESAASKLRDEAEVAAILEQYTDRLSTPESKARIQALLMSDRDAAIEILSGLPVAPVAAKADEPPAPQHDAKKDASGSSATDEQIAAAIGVEAKRLQTATPALSYAQAFGKAEKTVRAKVAAGQPV